VLLAQERLPEARAALADSLRLSHALDDGFAPNTEHSVADLDLDAGHYVEAARRYADVIANGLGSRRQNRRLDLYCVAGIAAALAALDHSRDALHLWSCVERREQASGLRLLQIERPRYQVWIDRARSALSIDEATAIAQVAAATPWDDAVRAAIAHARGLSS
jgi:hypothetical protein